MAAPLNRPTQFVCGIDFGTSGSGFGFSSDAGKTPPSVEERWDDAHGPVSKTLTQLLYDGDKVVAWGFSAPKEYAALQGKRESEENPPPDQLHLLSYFKLHIKDNPSGVFTAPHTSQQFAVLDVVVAYLQELWKKIQARIKEVHKKDIPSTDIKWCLSIPAIWKDDEKAFMRKAAFKAGLISNENASEDKFLLILEPEAAAAYCVEDCKNNQQPLADGSTFLIVDAGGGTIDLTSHQIRAERLYEYTEGDGGKFGSSVINQAFSDYLDGLLGKPTMETFRSKFPIDYYELMMNFERLKCNLLDYTDSLIALPQPLTASLSPKPPNLNFARKLTLNSATIREIFTPTLDEIEKLVQKQFDAVLQKHNKPFDYMFVVGGFGESELLSKMLQEKFGNMTKIRRPKKPISAVVSGAVILGCDPTFIRGRKARFTYGISKAVDFDPGVHPLTKKITSHKGDMCVDVFDTLITKGDDMEVDSCVVHCYTPVHKDQVKMYIKLYRTPKAVAEYIDEDNVKQIGQIDIDLQVIEILNPVLVNIYFGKTEIKVEAVEVLTGMKYTTSINFNGPFVVPQTLSAHLIFMVDISAPITNNNNSSSSSSNNNNNNDDDVDTDQEVMSTLQRILLCLQLIISAKGSVISLVSYHKDATLCFSELSPAEATIEIKKLLIAPKKEGRNIQKAISLLHSLMDKNSPQKVPTAFLMAGGTADEGADGKAELQNVMDKFKNIGFTFHVMLATQEEANSQPLKELAEVGKGRYTFLDLSADEDDK